MINFIKETLVHYGVSEKLSSYIANIMVIILILLLSYVAHMIIKTVILKLVNSYTQRTKTKWDSIIVEKRVINTLLNIVPFTIIYLCAPLFPCIQIWIERILITTIIIIILNAADKLFDAINQIYSNFEISKLRPIKGYLQVIQIALYIIATITIISIFLNKSPLFLLSGIGAATAVLMLIFQNSILGLVASIQISSNNMLQIGDCIEMPKYGADGSVIEITLHTVKVQNFDKTITTIPTHLLITDSFKNWRGMHEAGSRRIKRSIFIDVNSIRILQRRDIERLQSIIYISKYLNLNNDEMDSIMHDGKQLTNIGIFRRYLENYLKNNNHIISDITPVVRQLQPTERGLPIEIYAFTDLTQFSAYEELQSDLFDHILAIINNFGLRIYQEPSGYDLTFLYLRNETTKSTE